MILLIILPFIKEPRIPSFKELEKLQKLNQETFDSTIREMGYMLNQVSHDEKWGSDKFIYLQQSVDSDVYRLQRINDSVKFGKEQKIQIITTIELIIRNKKYYDLLMNECKISGYYFSGSYNFDRSIPNIHTEEYRKEAHVAKFSIGNLKNESREFYRVSISTSPK